LAAGAGISPERNGNHHPLARSLPAKYIKQSGTLVSVTQVDGRRIALWT
jgi:hypothetical protein